MRIGILGAGSLGGVIGASLAAAGQHVVLLARGAAARAIREHGITIDGGLAVYGRPEVVEDASLMGNLDVLLVTVKTYDTEQALEAVTPERVGAVASLQNGVLKDELLRRHFGPHKVLGCATMLGADRLTPTTIRCTFPGATFFGELDAPMTARLQELGQSFEQAHLPVHVTDRVLSLEWTKQVLQAATAPLSAITRVPLHEMYLGPAATLYVKIVREAAAVARARGIGLDATQSWGGPMAEIVEADDAAALDIVHEYGRGFVSRGATNIRISMQQDVIAGRRTEIDETAGYLVEEARRLGIEVPYLDFACQAVRALIR